MQRSKSMRQLVPYMYTSKLGAIEYKLLNLCAIKYQIKKFFHYIVSMSPLSAKLNIPYLP